MNETSEIASARLRRAPAGDRPTTDTTTTSHDFNSTTRRSTLNSLSRNANAEARKTVQPMGSTSVARIKEWLIGQRFLPGSAIGTAIKYIAGHWDGLVVFLDEPAVPIDNNRTERGFRGPALGRNNFYGSHSKQGTKVAAIFYSLIETAKLNGVAPKRYLKVALAAALAGEHIPLPFDLPPVN